MKFYKTLYLKDTLPLPYNLIDAKNSGFKLNYVGLKEGQSDYSLSYGVEGDFSIEISDIGIEISEICDLTVGNVYSFYKDLEKMMKNIKGNAVLKEYSGRTINISFNAKSTGKISVNGVYRAKQTELIDKLELSFEIEPNVLDNSLKHLKTLFDELGKIQGHYNFDI